MFKTWVATGPPAAGGMPQHKRQGLSAGQPAVRVQGGSEIFKGCEEQRHVSVPIQLSSYLLQARRLA